MLAMKALLRTFSIVALALAAASCKSSRGSDQISDELLNTQVYTKVGMHFDAKRGRYVMASTNYISVPIYLPPGSELTLTKKGRGGFTLIDGEDTEHVIEFRPKHSMMTMGKWYDMHFSSMPVQLPESLTNEERDGKHSDVDFLLQAFDAHERQSQHLMEQQLALPAYEQLLKGGHTFNLLDARGAISVTERAAYIGRIRNLARAVAKSYLASRARLGFPMAKKERADEVLQKLAADEAKKNKKAKKSKAAS